MRGENAARNTNPVLLLPSITLARALQLTHEHSGVSTEPIHGLIPRVNSALRDGRVSVPRPYVRVNVAKWTKKISYTSDLLESTHPTAYVV